MTSKLTPELEAMAAELALGVLEGEERAEALRHTLRNPDFAAMVQAWQDRLDPLGEGFVEAPPPNLWPAIEAKLDNSSVSQRVFGMRFWRDTAVAAGAIAACLAAVLVFSGSAMRSPKSAPEPTPITIAQIVGAQGVQLTARIDAESRRLTIRADRLPGTPLKPELWVIPDDGVPRSLGLIAPDGITQVTLSAQIKPFLVDGAALAVSLEDPASAPHSAPSSAPIALGRISSI